MEETLPDAWAERRARSVMKLETWRIVAAVCGVLAVAAAVAGLVMGPCTHGIACGDAVVPTRCTWAVRSAVLLQLVGAAAVFGLVPVKCKVGRRWLSGMGIGCQVLAVLCLYTPLVGVCAGADMACRPTALVMTVLGGAVVVMCAVMAALADPKRAQMPKRSL